jgi:2-polyprenyl-3-methyl-5-hydroxy-6-metoxy-1,4-benzoquinol methylase
MSDANRKSHWETVYTTKGENEVSWYQENPAPSLELIDLARPTPESAIVDIGGGASRLVDSLVARGFNHVTVLDISEAAVDAAKARLGERAVEVQWTAKGCGSRLKPKAGDCCVFCSYGSVPCPPIQEGSSCCT